MSEDKEDILNSYTSIRSQIAELELNKLELEPLVIQTALDRFAAKQGKKGSKNIYENNYGEIQLQFRTNKHKSEDSQYLQTLDELIQLESELSHRTNLQLIAEVKVKIAELENTLKNLTQTEKGLALIVERDMLIERLTTKVPMISFFLSKPDF